MLNSFAKLLSILFPPRETQKQVSACKPATLPYKATLTQDFWFLTDYSKPEIRALILENKFHNNTQAAQLLGYVLSQFILEKKLEKALFVPIPLGMKRERERGYNQVVHIIEKVEYPIHTASLLRRTKETQPQTRLPKQERLRNIKHAFSIHKSSLSHIPQTVVLVDDVATTGATLTEARITLQRFLPPDTKIICLAIAH